MTDIQANDVATEIAAIGEAIPPEDLAIVPKDLSRIVKDPLERIAELERALSATAKYAGRLSDLNSALMLGRKLWRICSTRVKRIRLRHKLDAAHLVRDRGLGYVSGIPLPEATF